MHILAYKDLTINDVMVQRLLCPIRLRWERKCYHSSLVISAR